MRITGRVVGRAVWVVTLALAASGLATPPALGAQATPPSLGAQVIDDAEARAAAATITAEDLRERLSIVAHDSSSSRRV